MLERAATDSSVVRSPATVDADTLSPLMVKEELRRIIASRHFRTSRRGKEFLQYVVDQTIEGHGDLLKERLIGAQLFGRKPDYATGEDPVVRVQAGDVRRRLESYHADPEIHPDILIHIPVGSYAPTFLLRRQAHEQETLTEPPALSASGELPSQAVRTESAVEVNHFDNAVPDPLAQKKDGSAEVHGAGSAGALRVPPRSPHKRYWIISAIVAVAALLSYVFITHQQKNADATLLDFWAPAASSQKPVLICLPRPVVYRPSAKLYDQYQKTHPDAFITREAQQDQLLPLAPSDTIQWQDMMPVRDAGISVGATVAAVNITKLLAEQGIRFELRFGDEATYADMRVSPVVIVGAINTQWITQLTSETAFAFDDTRGAPNIHETSGARRVWETEGRDGNRTRDYGLITRQLSGKSGQFFVQVAGITHFGTEAASEFLANKKEFAQAIRSQSIDVQHKNFQIVVSTDITAGRAGPPRLVAVHSW